MYVSDTGNHRILKVKYDGTITRIAGTGSPGFSGDGGQARSAQLNLPIGITVDRLGNLFIADSMNHRVSKLNTSTNIITTVLGDFIPGPDIFESMIVLPYSLAIDNSDNLFCATMGGKHTEFYNIPTYGRLIYKLNINTNTYKTIVPNLERHYNTPAADFPEKIPEFNNTTYFQIVIDKLGNLYTLDDINICKYDSSGNIISTFPYPGQNNSRMNLHVTRGFTFDSSNNLVFFTNYSGNIKKLNTSTGLITTMITSKKGTFSYDDGAPANLATLSHIASIAFDASGNIFLVDAASKRIRKINAPI